MTSHNLVNMHLSEELRESVPQVILCAVFSLVIHAEKPLPSETVFYAMLMNSMIY
jgi:hypothetical protein